MIVSSDGAARGNPGPAGIGFVVQDARGQRLAEVGEGIGIATNNVAEYRAAIGGLRKARALGATDVLLRSDSKLLIEQLAGRFKVRNARLIELHAEARELARDFRSIRYEHVPRERNREADRLANQGVDEWLRSGAQTPSGSRP